MGNIHEFLNAGGNPLQAAALSALTVTIVVIFLRRKGVPPNNRFNSDAEKAPRRLT